ncbi:MAG: 50S ribosomal protein L29 [Bacteroidota bacterium]|nr:50S ribosomal protein L29 [Bacteroidota bacterium]MDP4234710.1 50S ribosomal protein L29 [Bacteroidota bacterium]MDP4243933.1 50S ribosomal protein L29 [Bacteroidota bacterium]MDP4288844.1 50S ribosomal protein L29 [Bacteroidota bacterium]
MKGTKYAELANLNETEVQKQIADTRSRLVALKFQKTIGQLDNHAQFETLRRDIARMETSLRMRKPLAK